VLLRSEGTFPPPRNFGAPEDQRSDMERSKGSRTLSADTNAARQRPACTELWKLTLMRSSTIPGSLGTLCTQSS
jgi:hypothetical protein